MAMHRSSTADSDIMRLQSGGAHIDNGDGSLDSNYSTHSNRISILNPGSFTHAAGSYRSGHADQIYPGQNCPFIP
jgi:hypothetical protein